MPLTSYCKKCAADVEVSDRCPRCGAKLPPSTVRLAWCVDHSPVRDWMCWNAVMRIALPLTFILLALVVGLEALAAGVAGVEALLRGGLLIAVLGLLGLFTAVVLLALILQGEDILDCAIDSRGLHVQQYLPEPTALKLLLRLKSPRLMSRVSPEEPMLLLTQKEIAWKDVARVQLWPEKTLILLYSPAWWLRLSLPCTPFTWADALDFIRDKLGRKKNVVLPPELVSAAPPKGKKARPAREQQLTLEDLPALPAEPEQPEDFTSLQDVLEEVRQADSADAGDPPPEA